MEEGRDQMIHLVADKRSSVDVSVHRFLLFLSLSIGFYFPLQLISRSYSSTFLAPFC